MNQNVKVGMEIMANSKFYLIYIYISTPTLALDKVYKLFFVLIVMGDEQFDTIFEKIGGT